MENQAYEDEQSRATEELAKLESHCQDRQLHANTAIDGDSFIAKITTHAESHVYEDISTTAGSSSKISEQTFLPDEAQNTLETQERRSADFTKQAWASGVSSTTSPTIENSALSSSAEISANRDSVSSSSRALSRTNRNDTEVSRKKPRDFPETLHGKAEDNSSSSAQQNEENSSTAQSDRRGNRRRRKKDCKHCTNKLAGANSCEKLDKLTGTKDTILRKNEDDRWKKDSNVANLLLRDSILRSQNIKIYPILSKTNLRDPGKKNCPIVFPLQNGPHLTENAANLLANARKDKMLDQIMRSNPNKLLEVSKNEVDMRVNSIYSQDRWYGKDAPIFYTELKDQNPFQRAYSLPIRTHTPTSQNRVNLRRSVRNDPPPHPARLDKHRRGWTMHLARPLKTSGCSCSLVPLLVIVLILLGVAGVALYFVFEPEKLQVIQQYLKSTDKLTVQNATSGESFTPAISNDDPNLADANDTLTTETRSIDAFTMSVLSNSNQSFPGPTDAETEVRNASQNANATRYCDDCFEGEVCLALVDEEVPVCRKLRDSEDPTGCGGFCAVNKQKCHRLDVDAFRCVNMEHYCLEDEWTCSNALCIPMKNRCDGHMNCYDHSDEYNCVCNLETHFQCGNETSCLPLERRCDGKIDCWDATDEINCTLGDTFDWSCPLESEFTCNNGECILKVRFCDGLTDCSDGSDEPHGCQGKCNKHEFTCQNDRCITKGMKCNGIDDCGDGTDERHCKDRFT